MRREISERANKGDDLNNLISGACFLVNDFHTASMRFAFFQFPDGPFLFPRSSILGDPGGTYT